MKKKTNYSPEFKCKVVLELLKEEETVSQLASRHGVHPTQLNKWKKSVLDGIPELLADKRKKDSLLKEHEEERLNLYAQIGELTTKLNWLKKKSGIDIQ